MADRMRIKKIVAVDWDPRNLRIVHAIYNKRGVTIDRLLSVSIPKGMDTNDAQQMGKHIRRTLDQEGISTKHAIVDIPRDQVILKTLNLPTTQPEGLPSMVEIQIVKELPFPSMEAAIDFTVGLPSEDEATSDILVAAVRLELLEQYQSTFTAAGLKLERIGLRPFASKVAVCELLKHALPDCVLFIDVRPTFMEIDVLRGGSLVFSRSASVVIPEGVGDTTVIPMHPPESTQVDEAPALSIGLGLSLASDSGSSPSVVDSLLMEVTRSIEAYRANESAMRVDHVVVGGDVGIEEPLSEAIQSRLKVTTELYNPASSFGWEPDEGAGASAFAASLGLVLSQAQSRDSYFDFLHPQKSESAAQRRLKKAPMIAAVALLFLVAGGLGFSEYTKPNRELLAKLEKNIKTLKGHSTANRKFMKFYKETAQFEKDQLVWVDVLYEVFSVLPPNTEMLIGRLEMNQKDRRITIKTQTKKRETANEVVRKLEDFRREGHKKVRFRARVGQQTTKKKQKYPFVQDITIVVKDDGRVARSKSGK